MVKARDGVNIKIDDSVRHVFRRICSGMSIWDDPDYVGIVVEIDPGRLPLVGVDCGLEFVRWLPCVDIEHC